MSGLSAVLQGRPFHRPASQQYRFARRLAPAQRDMLEQALCDRVRNAARNLQERRAALTMWMAVQQARLRTYDEAQREQYALDRRNAVERGLCIVTLPAVPFMLWSLRRNHHRSPVRVEYAAAFDNFMRMLRDPQVPPELRETVAQRLDYHLRREGTIAPRQAELLRRWGAIELAESGYLVSEDRDLPPHRIEDMHVLLRRRLQTASGPEAPAGRLTRQELLADAVAALTGTHWDDLDLSALTSSRTQEVLDHLHDLGDRDSRSHARARLALEQARGRVEPLVRNLLALVAEGVRSERTLERARQGRVDRARRAVE